MSEVVRSSTHPTPGPFITPESAEYWAATLEGKLLVKHCRACDERMWYPRAMCPFCHSVDTEWETASGHGTIYTFTVVRRSGGDWKDAVPYVIAYVQLDEGPRVMTNIVDCDVEAVAIGDEVEVVFHNTGQGSALPRFRPVRPKLVAASKDAGSAGASTSIPSYDELPEAPSGGRSGWGVFGADDSVGRSTC